MHDNNRCLMCEGHVVLTDEHGYLREVYECGHRVVTDVYRCDKCGEDEVAVPMRCRVCGGDDD